LLMKLDFGRYQPRQSDDKSLSLLSKTLWIWVSG
jgi:hypothetical protein